MKAPGVELSLLLFAVVFGLTIRCTSPAYEIEGVVQDGLYGGVIDGVEVTLEGTGISALTDRKGEFSLKIP